MRLLTIAIHMFFGVWARSQTPSTYPYFNRIHLASDSTHPSFYHFYAGGVQLSEDTILLLGHQFWGGNDQIYQRTLEFIDVNTGDLLEKIIEPNEMAIENPPFSSAIIENNFYNLGTISGGARTLRKYSDVYHLPIEDHVLDAYPNINQHDFYRGFTVTSNNNLLLYGISPNDRTLISIYDTSGVLLFHTDFSHILNHITSNQGRVVQAKQLMNNAFLVQTRIPNSQNTWIGDVFILNEDFSWNKKLLSINQTALGSFFQHTDSSIFLIGFRDTTLSPNNPQFNSFVFKFDKHGDLLWKKYYPISQIQMQDQSRPIASALITAKQLKSGNLLLIGNDIYKGGDSDYQQMNGEQSLQTRLLCINPDGDKIWERSFHTSADNSSLGLGFIPLANDDIIIYGGIIEDFFFYQKAFVAKVNCLGRMTDLMHDVQLIEQDGIVSVQIEADSFFETTIDWGDSTPTTSFQTSYADSSELFFAQHQYAQSKPYQITVSTRGCKDTLVYELIQEAHVPDNNEAALSMFPNPTLGFFQIKIPTNELLNLEVTDEFGKIVYQNKDVSLFNGFEIDLSLQPVGMYYISITGKARSWKGKVVKI